MPSSQPDVQIAFNSFKTFRIIIQILTILIILIVIAACIVVGIVVATRGISAFEQTSTILIFQSNMKIVLNRSRPSYESDEYYCLSNSSNTQYNVTVTLNQTLCQAFSDSYLTVAISPLSLLPCDESNSSTLLFTFTGEAFFNQNYTGNEIKDALGNFQITITLTDCENTDNTSSGPAFFNFLLSNVTDAELTNLTLADLPFIVITNSST